MIVQQIESVITFIMAVAMVMWIIASLLYYPKLNWWMLKIMLVVSFIGTIVAGINAQISYNLGENHMKFAIIFVVNFMLFIVSALLLDQKIRKL